MVGKNVEPCICPKCGKIILEGEARIVDGELRSCHYQCPETDEYLEGIMNRGEEEMSEKKDLTGKSDGKVLHVGDVAHPICPINMYFEGDEDICDTSKCDFENRCCTEACRIDIPGLVKEVAAIKPKKEEDTTYPKEVEVLPHMNKPGTFGIFPVPSTDTSLVIAEFSDLDDALEFAHRWNNFSTLLTMCRSNKVFFQQIKTCFEMYPDSPTAQEMVSVLNLIDKQNEDVITWATKRIMGQKEVEESPQTLKKRKHAKLMEDLLEAAMNTDAKVWEDVIRQVALGTKLRGDSNAEEVKDG